MDPLRRAFVFAAAAWALALPLATLAASRVHVDYASATASVVVYGIGAIVCHQLPARSFHFWGAQMPVCARCLGIYFGAAIAALVVGAARLTPPRASFIARRTKLTAAAAATPSAATLVYEWTTGIMPSNPVRFAAGLWLGALLAAMVVAATSPPAPEVN